jgi:hypothetical protein
MIGKYHPIGTRVVVDTKGWHQPIPEIDGKAGLIMSEYGQHQTATGIYWGYIVRLDSGQIIVASRRLLDLADEKPAKAPSPPQNRGDLDDKVSWDDCPWRPSEAA